MLQLTRLSGPVFALNPDLIERAEATPDTVVTLVNGSKYVILESLDELIELIHNYRASLVSAAQAAGGFAPTGAFGAAAGGYGGSGPSGGHSGAGLSGAGHASTARPFSRRESPTTGTVVALHPGEQ